MKVNEVVIRGTVDGDEVKKLNEEGVIVQFTAWFEATARGSKLVKDGYKVFDSEIEGIVDFGIPVRLRYDKE